MRRILTKSLKIVVLISLALLFSVALYAVSSFVVFGFIITPDFSLSSTEIDPYSYSGIKGMRQENGAFFTETNDCRVFYAAPSHEVSAIVITCHSISTEPTHLQAFYAKEGEVFSETNSERVSFYAGVNTIEIPRNVYESFRIDFTNEAGVSLNVDKISFDRVDKNALADMLLLDAILEVCIILLFLGFAFRKKLLLMSERVIAPHPRIALLLMMLISCIVVYGSLALRGDAFVYSDIGADTMNQYYPTYSFIVNIIKEQDFSAWSAELGLGTNLLVIFSFLGNPFGLPTIAAGVLFGNAAIAYALVFSHMLKLIVCGLLCYRYLGFFGFSNGAKILASYVFSLNGFLTLWGQHYQLGTYCFWCILLLVLIERSLKRDRFFFSAGLFVVTALLMASSVYAAYMILLFLAVYVIFRLFALNEKGKLKATIKRGLSILVTVCTGLAASSVASLPGIFDLMNTSSRLSAKDSIMERVASCLLRLPSLDTVIETFERGISNNLSGTGWAYQQVRNYYEFPQLFFSVFLLIAAFQWVFTIHRRGLSLPQAILRYTAAALTLYLLLNPLLPMALNGFVKTFGRYTFLLMPLFAAVFAQTFDNAFRKRLFSPTALVISLAATAGLIIANDPAQSQIRAAMTLEISSVVILAIFVVMLAVFIVRRESIKMGRTAVTVMGLLLMVNMTMDSFITTNLRDTVPLERLNRAFDSETAAALDYIEENEPAFCRVEKTFRSVNDYTDSWALYYDSLSTYNSTLNENVKTFNTYYSNSDYTGEKSHLQSFVQHPQDLVLYSLLGLKYVLGKGYVPNYGDYELVESFGDVRLYRNRYVSSALSFFTETISESDFFSLSYAERICLIPRMLVLPDDYGEFTYTAETARKLLADNNAISTLAQEVPTEMAPAAKYSIDVGSLSGDGRYVLTLTVSSEQETTFDVVMNVDGADAENQFSTNFEAGTTNETSYLLPEGTDSLTFTATGKVTVTDIALNLIPAITASANGAVEIVDGNDSHLNGRITVDKDGFVFVPVPYQTGWTAEIDGEPAEIIRGDTGFTALRVSAGEYSFALTYDLPMLRAGAIISAVTILAVIAYIILNARYRKKNSSKEMANTNDRL